MRSVLLSTTNAEYIELSEVVKEIKFIIQLLNTMNVDVETPSQYILIMWEQYGFHTTEQPVEGQNMYT